MRRIIVLEIEPRDNAALHIPYALWANVAPARQPFWQRRQGATFTSAVQDGSVTAAETAALQSGAVVERVVESEWPTGTTVPQAQAFLQQALADFQTFVGAYNPWARYGSFFDDTTGVWTGRAVA
jgi:hypothetical protein